jgi:hypothetical protein
MNQSPPLNWRNRPSAAISMWGNIVNLPHNNGFRLLCLNITAKRHWL